MKGTGMASATPDFEPFVTVRNTPPPLCDWMAGWLVGWVAGWVLGSGCWLVGWLAGWLVWDTVIGFDTHTIYARIYDMYCVHCNT